MDEFIYVMMRATKDGMSRTEIITRAVAALYNNGYRVVPATADRGSGGKAAPGQSPTGTTSGTPNADGRAGSEHAIDQWLTAEPAEPAEAQSESAAQAASAPQAAKAAPQRPSQLAAPTRPRPQGPSILTRLRKKMPALGHANVIMAVVGLIVVAVLAYSMSGTSPRSSGSSGPSIAPQIHWGGRQQ